MCGLWLGAEEGNSGLLISFVFHVSLWPFLGWNPRDGSLLVPSQWRRNRHHFSNNDSFMKLGCLSQSLDAIIRHVFLPSLCRWLQLAADLWQPDSVCYLFWTKALNNWIGRPGKQIWYFKAQTTVCWVLLGECRGPLFNLILTWSFGLASNHNLYQCMLSLFLDHNHHILITVHPVSLIQLLNGNTKLSLTEREGRYREMGSNHA